MFLMMDILRFFMKTLPILDKDGNGDDNDDDDDDDRKMTVKTALITPMML